MYDKLFDGHCPQCLLGDRFLPMRLNRGDVFECPECRLLVALAPPFRAVVLRRRGQGNLKNSADGRYDAPRQCAGLVMVREKGDDLYMPDGFNDFPTEDEFREYTEGAVEIDSHV